MSCFTLKQSDFFDSFHVRIINQIIRSKTIQVNHSIARVQANKRVRSAIFLERFQHPLSLQVGVPDRLGSFFVGKSVQGKIIALKEIEQAENEGACNAKRIVVFKLAFFAKIT